MGNWRDGEGWEGDFGGIWGMRFSITYMRVLTQIYIFRRKIVIYFLKNLWGFGGMERDGKGILGGIWGMGFSNTYMRVLTQIYIFSIIGQISLLYTTLTSTLFEKKKKKKKNYQYVAPVALYPNCHFLPLLLQHVIEHSFLSVIYLC